MTHLIPIGIDVGKSGFHLSIADGANPRKYPIHEIKYSYKIDKETHINTDWRDELKRHITHTPLLTIEPTGINYSTPIIHALLDAFPDAQIFWVNHNVVANARSLYLSRAKSDNLDAQALAWIAEQITLDNAPRGVYEYDPVEQHQRITLRHLVNQHVTIEKQSTRAKNQLDAIFHNIAPELNNVREQLIKFNIPPITPITKDQLDTSIHGITRNTIHKYCAHLPNFTPAPRMLKIVQDHYNNINATAELLEEVERKISQVLDQEPLSHVANLWRTVPHVSDLVIASMLVPASPLRANKDEYKRAVGVAPLTNKSGARDTVAWKQRSGYRPAMQKIHMLCITATNEKSTQIPELLKFKQNHSMSAVKRKFVQMMWGVANSGKPYSPYNLAPREEES